MIIRREVLAAASVAVTDDDTRFTLGSVQIEPGSRAVATNGNVLIVATDKNPTPDDDFPIVPGAEFHESPATPVLVPRDTVKRLVAASKPGKRSLPVLQTIQFSTNGDPNTVTAVATDLVAPTIARLVREDGVVFPQYQRVIPSSDRPVARLIMAREVLETLCAAVKALGQKSSTGGTLTFEIPIGPEARGARVNPDTGELTGDKGVILTAIRVTHDSPDVALNMVAMPCHL